MNAVITLSASVLDTLSADIKSKLETSARFEVVSSNAFAVNAEGKDFEVDIASNSTVTDFAFVQQDKKVSFVVEGETGTRGVTQITIPKALLSGEMMVSIDGEAIPPESSDVVAIADTEEGLTLEINYHHSEHSIEVSGTNVIPEFPLTMVVMAAAISSVIVAVSMMRRSLSLR
jgi:PDZ domain-containing secreted protein